MHKLFFSHPADAAFEFINIFMPNVKKRITGMVTNDRSRIKTDEDLCDRNTFIWQKGDRRKTTLTHFVRKVNREKQ